LLLAGVASKFFGIPLALAAFVAGLAITESSVAAAARQRLLPVSSATSSDHSRWVAV